MNWLRRFWRGIARRELAVLVVVLALLCLALAGCGRRAPDARADALAQANAGAWAMVSADSRDDRATIRAGVADYLVAANDGKALPDPVTAPEAILADPVAFQTAGAKARKDASGWGMAGILAGATIAVGIALRVAKNLPGLAGLAGSLADMAWRQFAPAKAIEADQRAGAALQSAIQYGHAVTTVASATHPEAVEDIKRRCIAAQDRLGVRDEITAILATMKDR